MSSTAKSRQKSVADAEGYQAIKDENLRHVVDGRMFQLELELAGHRLFISECEADPHPSAQAIEQTQRDIASLEARLQHLAERRASLGEPSTDEG